MRVRTFAVGVFLLSASIASAQEPQPHHHPPEDQQAAREAATEAAPMTGPLGISLARDASGTAWLPEATPMFAVHGDAGAWGWMLHENLFLQFINEGGDRGDTQFGSTNWVMGMARRSVAGGPLTLRGMISVEPATVGECGYPTLLATGESCNGEPLHDRQHPHDVFMELAAEYKREISSQLGYQLYGALAGEPALGPVAFPHRVSAMPNPIAPMSHHWLDSTHIAFGVLTGGLFHRKWKAEASLFNGREPDETRYDLDLGALDSYSGRFWWLPSERWALQLSAGHLEEAESEHVGGPRHDVDRITGAITYHRPSDGQRFWATTMAWGQNREDGVRTNAVVAESTVALDGRNTIFGRGEINEKAAHDLVLPDHHDESLYTVGKIQAGYVRHLRHVGSFVPGLGASVSMSIVPDRLAPFYGGRWTPGFAVFFSLRPAEMPGSHQHK